MQKNRISINNINEEIMFKNVMKVAVVVAIAMVAGINVFNAQKPEALSDVAMENVEALAGDENGYVDLPCVYLKDEYCTYTAKLKDGRTQPRKEFDLINYN